MTYQKLLDFIKGMTAEQRQMNVVVINDSDTLYLFPTMLVTVVEDVAEENGFLTDQPLLG